MNGKKKKKNSCKSDDLPIIINNIYHQVMTNCISEK